VTLQRAEKRNAVDRLMLEELVATVGHLDADPRVQVVVLAAAGPHFSGGVDLDESAGIRARGEEAFAEFVGLGCAAVAAFTGMRAVTIASIQGKCLGGGVALAAACDFRVAGEDAVFVLPEVQLGFPFMWDGIPMLLRQMNPAVVKDLLLTCRPLGAAEALRIGFADRVAPGTDPEGVTADLAAELAAMPGPALLETKQMIRAALAGRLDAAAELEAGLTMLEASGEISRDR
jgi:enoyl-CoA hydratase/carnithine racemase